MHCFPWRINIQTWEKEFVSATHFLRIFWICSFFSYFSVSYFSIRKKEGIAPIPKSSQRKLLYFVLSSQQFPTNNLGSVGLVGCVQQTAMLFCVFGSHYLPYKTVAVPEFPLRKESYKKWCHLPLPRSSGRWKFFFHYKIFKDEMLISSSNSVDN